jgi:hypothetical protein
MAKSMIVHGAVECVKYRQHAPVSCTYRCRFEKKVPMARDQGQTRLVTGTMSRAGIRRLIAVFGRTLFHVLQIR